MTAPDYYSDAITKVMSFSSRGFGDEDYAKSKLLEKILQAKQSNNTLPPLYMAFVRYVRESHKIKATSKYKTCSPSRMAALAAIQNAWIRMFSSTDITDDRFKLFTEKYAGKRISGLCITPRCMPLIQEAMCEDIALWSAGDQRYILMAHEHTPTDIPEEVQLFRRKLLHFVRWSELMQHQTTIRMPLLYMVKLIAPDLVTIPLETSAARWSPAIVTLFETFLSHEDNITRKQQTLFVQTFKKYEP
jgi:hypothetical protein